MKKISFVIPCYNSSKTIGSVIDEIDSIFKNNKKYNYEVVAVNDQSPDNVWEVIKNICKNNNNVKGVCLAKNMNKGGAVMAGLSISEGDYIVFIDDDGQCPLDRFWDLLKPIEEGHDVSIAKYTEYKQSVFKSFGTVFNRKMTEVVIGKPKGIDFTNFMIMKKYIADEIVKYKNPYPYFTGLILRTTKDIVNVEMEERSRLNGKSNYTIKKLISLWLDGFTAFSVKPLRISTLIGLLLSCAGFVYALVIIFIKLFSNQIILPGYSSLMAAFLFIGGVIMVMLGIVGEYIGRIYICINNSPQYVIKETTNYEKGK